MYAYFSLAFNAVMPFILYMAFGYATVHLFKQTREDFLTKLNSLTFRCFFPILMFNNFYKMDLSGGFRGGFILFSLIAVLSLVALLFLTVGRLVHEHARTGVIIQAIFRSNSILFALPLSQSVFGEAGVQASSMLVAVIVPLYNILAVIVLEYYNGTRPTAWELLKRILTNPLIMGAIAGCIFLLLKVKLPGFIAKPVGAFADLTTPLSLFILGGMLHFSSFKRNLKVISLSMLFKLILFPALLVLLMLLFDFTGAERFAVFCLFATPVAVSSYTMAANMGGEEELAGHFVAFSTIASLFTIFGWIVALKALSFI